jgi:hypothetical protein
MLGFYFHVYVKHLNLNLQVDVWPLSKFKIYGCLLMLGLRIKFNFEVYGYDLMVRVE